MEYQYIYIMYINPILKIEIIVVTLKKNVENLSKIH